MAGNDGAASIQACAMRLSRLAADGTTPAGATNTIVTNAFISAEFKAVLESGDEFTVKNACGGIHTSYKQADALKRYDVTVTTPNPDIEQEEMMTGGTLVTGGGQSIGYSAPAVGATLGNGVCLELWTRAWVGGGPPAGVLFTDAVTTNASAALTSASATFTTADVGRTISGTGIPAATTILAYVSPTAVTLSANATASATGVSITIGRPGAYWRYVVPKWLAAPGDFKIEGAPLQPGFSGPTWENPSIGNGPSNDWPAGLLATSGRSYSRFRDSALPSLATVGYQATPAQV